MKTLLVTILFTFISIATQAQPANRLDVVRAIKARISSTIDLTHGPGECGRFEITKRVAWELRSAGAGFLTKTGAQNKCNEENSTDAPGYGVDIIMYPDGTVIDILGGGAEGPNTPQWMTLGPSPVSSWRPPFDPGDDIPLPPPPPGPTPPSEPPSPPLPPSGIDDRLVAIQVQIAQVHTEVMGVRAAIDKHEADQRAFLDRVVGFLKDPKTILTILGLLGGRFALP